MFLVTIWFLYVQVFLLHVYCRYCLFSAAITCPLAGLVIALLARRIGLIGLHRTHKPYRLLTEQASGLGFPSSNGLSKLKQCAFW